MNYLRPNLSYVVLNPLYSVVVKVSHVSKLYRKFATLSLERKKYKQSNFP